MTCTFAGCDRPKKYKLFCRSHYRHSRSGELKPLRRSIQDLNDFMSRTSPSADCLQWETPGSNGYSNCWYDGRSWKAHRLAYHLSTSENITGRPIHHKCANKWCVKPDHLQLATTAENTLEMNARKGYEAEISMLKREVEQLKGRLSRYEEV